MGGPAPLICLRPRSRDPALDLGLSVCSWVYLMAHLCSSTHHGTPAVLVFSNTIYLVFRMGKKDFFAAIYSTSLKVSTFAWSRQLIGSNKFETLFGWGEGRRFH